MISLTLGLFTQVSDSGPRGPLVDKYIDACVYLSVLYFHIIATNRFLF